MNADMITTSDLSRIEYSRSSSKLYFAFTLNTIPHMIYVICTVLYCTDISCYNMLISNSNIITKYNFNYNYQYLLFFINNLYII